ncbi:hypothetical protein WN66_00170 [Saccharomyces cerevisiae]|nr:hypothetical protein WN66_00170 [Saccharomyces cerevisiae]
MLKMNDMNVSNGDVLDSVKWLILLDIKGILIDPYSYLNRSRCEWYSIHCRLPIFCFLAPCPSDKEDLWCPFISLNPKPLKYSCSCVAIFPLSRCVLSSSLGSYKRAPQTPPNYFFLFTSHGFYLIPNVYHSESHSQQVTTAAIVKKMDRCGHPTVFFSFSFFFLKWLDSAFAGKRKTLVSI